MAGDKFYTEENVLAQFKKGRDEVKVMIGKKEVRGEQKEYLDIRKWYYDDGDELQPGKGFASPMTREEMKVVGEAIVTYSK